MTDLSDWRYEGVIFEKGKAPRNGNLFAPDVIQGLDGRFYLYFSKDDSSVIGAVVCDTPAGRYEYIGEVSYRDGKSLGDDENEYFMFDPSVLIDGEGSGFTRLQPQKHDFKAEAQYGGLYSHRARA